MLLLVALSFINSQNIVILTTSFLKDDSKLSHPYPPYNGDTLYVGPDGNDSYTREQAMNYNTPWLTIQKAVDESEAGDFIIVKDGVYKASEKYNSVVCIEWDWGEDTNWRILKAEHEHKAVINGSSMDQKYGILIGDSDYWFIEGFEICSVYVDGIHYEASNHDIYLYHNKIHAVCRDTVEDWFWGYDGIFIKRDSWNTTIDGNIIYDIGRFPDPAIDGPWSDNYKHDHGIYAQGYITIINNIIYDCPAGWAIKVDGNDIGDPGFTHIIANNTFANINLFNPQRPGFIRMVKSADCDYKPRALIVNNLFYDPPVIDSCRHAVDMSYNYKTVVVNCLTNRNSIIETRAQYFDSVEIINCYTDYSPYFVDIEKMDFHISDSSFCIDKGIADSVPDYDMDMYERPQGSGYDIGAYEYHEGSSSFPDEERKWYELNISSIINNEIAINYSVERREYINISIYDMLGRETTVLVDGIRNPGHYSLFKKVDIASGTYFIVMKTQTSTKTQKFIYFSNISINYNYLPKVPM